MRHPIVITFPGMTPSPWIEGEIRTRAAKLDALCPGILSCHVAVDIPHRHHVRGNQFRLRIDLKVRGEEFVVVREGLPGALRRVLREAFDTARRQLLDTGDSAAT